MDNLPGFDNLTDSQQRIIMRTNVISLNSDVQRMKKILIEGEDEVLPVLERVRNLEGYVAGWKFWMRTIAVAILLQTVVFGAAVIAAFARFYPLLEKLASQP